MMRKTQISWMIVASLAVILLAAGCAASPTTQQMSVPAAEMSQPSPDKTVETTPISSQDNITSTLSPADVQAGEPEVPIHIQLTISKPPRLGETATLTCTVVSEVDAIESHAQIELPKGARLLDGVLTWQGALQANVPVQFAVTAQFNEEGVRAAECKGGETLADTRAFGTGHSLLLGIGKESGVLNPTPGVGDPRLLELIQPGNVITFTYPTGPLPTPDRNAPSPPPPTAQPTPSTKSLDSTTSSPADVRAPEMKVPIHIQLTIS